MDYENKVSMLILLIVSLRNVFGRDIGFTSFLITSSKTLKNQIILDVVCSFFRNVSHNLDKKLLAAWSMQEGTLYEGVVLPECLL
jgi:hypothetical protein